MTTRIPAGRYDDPVDLVWRRCAARLGMRLVRDPDVFASWDGRGTLSVCPESEYDPDDSLAQLVFHEVCHALVQGAARRTQVDWGLINTDDRASAVAEHACHRLQAALADRHGLRELLAVTTDWRPYWDALPDDPLADGDDPAIPLAVAAWPEAVRGPWSGPIDDALRATAQIADAVRDVAPEGSLWSRTRPRHPVAAWAVATPGRAAHGLTCGSCAWGHEGVCRATEGSPAVAPDAPACVAGEPVLRLEDCGACGACCREGFHAVEVAEGDPFAHAHPELLVHDAHGAHVPRPGGRCRALTQERGLWRCVAYAVRPRSCRAFAVAGEACLEARRRVGLTRR